LQLNSNIIKSLECVTAGVMHSCFLIHVSIEPNWAMHNTVSRDPRCPPPLTFMQWTNTGQQYTTHKPQ